MVDFSDPIAAAVAAIALGVPMGALVAASVARQPSRSRRRSPSPTTAPPFVELGDGGSRARESSALVSMADPESAAWVDAAMRSLSARPIWEGEHIAQPLVATATDGWLEMQLDGADPMGAPVPWVDVGGGRRWRLMRSTPVGQLPAATLDRPIPAMVTVGDGVLVNLEGLGLLTVDGPLEQGMDLLRSIVQQLLTAGHRSVDVRSTFAVTGIVARGLVCRRSPAQLMAEIPGWLDRVEDRLGQRRAHTAYGHRLGGGEPVRTVVVVTDPVGARDMPTILEAAGQRRLPLAVVILGGSAEDGEAGIVFGSHESATLEPWSIDFVPQQRSPSGGRRLAELVDGCTPRRSARRARRPAVDPMPRATAGQHHPPAHPRPRPRSRSRSWSRQPAVAIGPEPKNWPHGTGRRRHPLRPSSTSVARPSASARLTSLRPAPEPPRPEPSHTAPVVEGPEIAPEAVVEGPEIAPEAVVEGPEIAPEAVVEGPEIAPEAVVEGPEISVLGGIEIVGLGEELTSQQLSLLTFLACHPASAREAIIDALWDGQVISKSRFPNLLAETRRRVGRHRLPEATEGRYHLAGIRTDLERFEACLTRAAGVDPSEAAEQLRSALGLVRGVPFTPPGARFWSWVNDHGHVAARVESSIADAAVRLARVEQRAGRLDDARWACERGLAASPADQTLVTTLAEVYRALGKPALATRLLESWEERVAQLDRQTS